MQLDMRRKAEVLKYSANKSSTQTNSLTKKQQFALLIKGGIASPSQAVMKSNSVTCAADELILTPTSSSDVPGPVMYLYNDETVPLYNYSEFNTRTYAEFVPTNQGNWQFIVQSDVLLNNNGTSNIYYLIINNKINQPLYTYNIVTPVAITVAGSIPRNYAHPSTWTSGNITIYVNTVKLEVRYNDAVVKEVEPVTLSDFAITIRTPITNDSSGSIPFSCTQFVGNLAFNNIPLYTAPTYVYTFVFTTNIRVVPPDTGIVNYVGLVVNVSNTPNRIVGCELTDIGQKPLPPVGIASITGV